MIRKRLCLNSVQSSHKELFNHSGVSCVLAFTIRLVEQNQQSFKQRLTTHAFWNAFFSIIAKLKIVTVFSAAVNNFSSIKFKVISPLSPPENFFIDFSIGTGLFWRRYNISIYWLFIIIVVYIRCRKHHFLECSSYLNKLHKCKRPACHK